MADPGVTDEALRQEARGILEDLAGLLDPFGDRRAAGSFALGTMTWRDLDVYVLAGPDAQGEFARLGPALEHLLGARRLSFKDHRERPLDGWLHGLYWGVRFTRGDADWKLDLWGFESDVFHERIEALDRLDRRITPELRRVILDLKTVLCTHPEHRKSFSTWEIYQAVLDHGVRTVAGFWALREEGIAGSPPGASREPPERSYRGT